MFSRIALAPEQMPSRTAETDGERGRRGVESTRPERSTFDHRLMRRAPLSAHPRTTPRAPGARSTVARGGSLATWRHEATRLVLDTVLIHAHPTARRRAQAPRRHQRVVPGQVAGAPQRTTGPPGRVHLARLTSPAVSGVRTGRATAPECAGRRSRAADPAPPGYAWPACPERLGGIAGVGGSVVVVLSSRHGGQVRPATTTSSSSTRCEVLYAELSTGRAASTSHTGRYPRACRFGTVPQRGREISTPVVRRETSTRTGVHNLHPRHRRPSV